MNAGAVSAVLTVVFFVLFIAIVAWTYHRGNKQKFDDAADLPFREDADDTGRRH